MNEKQICEKVENHNHCFTGFYSKQNKTDLLLFALKEIADLYPLLLKDSSETERKREENILSNYDIFWNVIETIWFD